MLIFISSFIVIMYSIILFLVGKVAFTQKSDKIAKCVPMSYGMIMSTVVGLIITFIYPNDLAVTTVASIIVSFTLAILIGMLYGLSGVIEALGASVMGAMMGAMLAAMTPVDRISFLMIAMDILFVLFIGVLLYYMKQHSIKQHLFNKKKVTLGASILAVATCASLVTSVTLDQVDTQQEMEPSEHSSHH